MIIQSQPPINDELNKDFQEKLAANSCVLYTNAEDMPQDIRVAWMEYFDSPESDLMFMPAHEASSNFEAYVNGSFQDENLARPQKFLYDVVDRLTNNKFPPEVKEKAIALLVRNVHKLDLVPLAYDGKGSVKNGIFIVDVSRVIALNLILEDKINKNIPLDDVVDQFILNAPIANDFLADKQSNSNDYYFLQDFASEYLYKSEELLKYIALQDQGAYREEFLREFFLQQIQSRFVHNKNTLEEYYKAGGKIWEIGYSAFVQYVGSIIVHQDELILRKWQESSRYADPRASLDEKNESFFNHLKLNLQAIVEIEKNVPGGCRRLNEYCGLINFHKYPTNALVEQAKALEHPASFFEQVEYISLEHNFDHNEAFMEWGRIVDELICKKENISSGLLHKKRVFLAYDEPDSSLEILHSVATTKTKRFEDSNGTEDIKEIKIIIIGAHGHEGINIGDISKDILEKNSNKVREISNWLRLDGESSIVLFACNSGKSGLRSIANEFSKAFNVLVHGAPFSMFNNIKVEENLSETIGPQGYIFQKYEKPPKPQISALDEKIAVAVRTINTNLQKKLGLKGTANDNSFKGSIFFGGKAI